LFCCGVHRQGEDRVTELAPRKKSYLNFMKIKDGGTVIFRNVGKRLLVTQECINVGIELSDTHLFENIKTGHFPET